MFKKIFLLSLIFGSIIFLVAIYLPSFTQYRELKRQDEQLAQEISELKVVNNALEKEAQLLRTDVKYLEKVVREDLGLVKPGEVVYKLVPREDGVENSL